MIEKLIDSKILSTVISVGVSFFLVALIVYGASTISTNISTGGTLDVTATSTFNDGSADYDFRIESDGQEYMFFMDAGNNKISIASSTPWGQFSVEAVQGVANASSPIFVIGDQGTSSPLFQIGAKNGNAVFASNAVFNEDGLDEDFRIEGDTKTNVFYLDASADSVGIASTTPWGQFSVEAVQGVANASRPIFVIGDQGTTTPMFIVDGNDGRVGIASTSPYVALGVTGTTTSSLGMTIGASGSGISNLLFGTCQINFPSIAPGVDAVDSCPATGTAVGDRIFITPILPDGLVFFSASATAANTIQVAVINSSTTVLATAPSINPQAEQWSWMAIR